jgi:uncharacterized protein (TIGR03083 family)
LGDQCSVNGDRTAGDEEAIRDDVAVKSETVDIYLAASRAFADQVAALPSDGWDRPGLGDWDVRSLVGHTGRSLVTVLSYLQQPAPDINLEHPGDYIGAVRQHLSSAAGTEVTDRGRQAGIDLGDEPAIVIHDLVTRVTAALGALNGDPVITTIAGGMLVSAYLPTRTFELVVHSLDIAEATGVEAALPDAAVAEALRLATDAAASLGEGTTVLRALTGRAGLPDGYNVVG